MQQFQPSNFFPPVVKYIMITNGVLFLLTQFSPLIDSIFNQYLALYYPSSSLFIPTQCITHLFMHASLGHLFSNMFSLWMFGSILENLWGSKKFLIFYLICGVGAALIHTSAQWWDIHQIQTAINNYKIAPGYDTLLRFYNTYIQNGAYGFDYTQSFDTILGQWQNNMNDTSWALPSIDLVNQAAHIKLSVPTVGASGAVFGILMAFGMFFPNSMLYIYFLFPIKVKYFVALYALMEMYLAMQNNPSDNVAHFAHLGGMFIAFILIRKFGFGLFRK